MHESCTLRGQSSAGLVGMTYVYTYMHVHLDVHLDGGYLGSCPGTMSCCAQLQSA